MHSLRLSMHELSFLVHKAAPKRHLGIRKITLIEVAASTKNDNCVCKFLPPGIEAVHKEGKGSKIRLPFH